MFVSDVGSRSFVLPEDSRSGRVLSSRWRARARNTLPSVDATTLRLHGKNSRSLRDQTVRATRQDISPLDVCIVAGAAYLVLTTLVLGERVNKLEIATGPEAVRDTFKRAQASSFAGEVVDSPLVTEKDLKKFEADFTKEQLLLRAAK